ncbi:MAG: TlpA family protein disulfide reductase [Proteobacteria bacterium]|nr:TlpA family protein disulfide reductase [Pseudomonadota bacterium]
MNPGWRWALTAGLSVAAVLTGSQLFHLMREHRDAAASAAAAAGSLPETSIVAQPRAGIQPQTGIPAQLPAFSLSDLAGHPTPVSQWQGKSLMINFWATWCAPCRREIPLLQTLHHEFKDGDFEVLGIAVDFPDKVRGFRDQYKITYPLLVGEQDALDLIAKLGVATPAFPFTVFTDRRGRIVTLYLGELNRPVAAAILATVEDVNRDRLELAAARTRIADEVRALRANLQSVE